MMSRRPPTDGDSSRPAVLPAACPSLGAALAEARAARGLSVDDVARRLLLSHRQVLGLEQADPSAFYNHAYFLKALRKYLADCGLPAGALDEPPPAATGEPEDQLRLTLGSDGGAMGALDHVAPARRVWIGLAAGLALAVVAGSASWWALGQSSARWDDPVVADAGTGAAVAGTTPLPANPVQMPAAVPPPVVAMPARVMLEGSPGDALDSRSDGTEDGAAVRISVGKATWVFVRHPDNRVAEHRLDAGEELVVSHLPVYLVVGTADAVEVLIDDQPVPLDRYTNDGQIRIGRSQLAALRGRE